MTPFLKKTSRCYFVTITTRERTYVRVSSGTRDKEVATAMQDMLTAMSRRGSRLWDLIDAMTTGPRKSRLKVADAYDYYPDRLEELRATIKVATEDPDLGPSIDLWDKDLDKRVKAGRLAVETVRHYRRQVNAIFPIDETDEENPVRLPVRKSTLTPAFFKGKLAALGGSGTNKRRHAAAWASVIAFLIEDEKLERNPLDEVTIPKNNKSKSPHIERLADVIRFVNHLPIGPHRAAAAFREGAGVEMQAMLNTRKRDIVDVEHRVMWAHGEKNDARDRQVIVDEWAWSIIMAYVKANPMTDDAKLFGDITAKSHRQACYDARDELRAQGVNIPANYKPHNSRNTFYVRGLKEGRDPVLLSNNLGHTTTAEGLRRYGKHRPLLTDLIRADQRGKKEG